MQFIHNSHRNDTIAALATPPGIGGIAIVRISGAASITCVEKLVQKDLSQQLTPGRRYEFYTAA